MEKNPSSQRQTHTLKELKKRMGFGWLVGAGLLTALLWQFSWGDYILYPFSILATWFHEMGHGLTAMLLGGNFEKLLLYPDGGGLAQWSYRRNLLFGSIGRALVSAGGLMGPPIAGSIFILSSRRFKTAHYSLVFLGVALLLSVLIWVRTPFGLLSVSALGIVILTIAIKSPHWVQGFAIQLLGVQACVSTFHQIDYLFTRTATVGGSRGLSDTGQIAQQLLLPYWFWGSLVAVGSLFLLIQSLRLAYRRK